MPRWFSVAIGLSLLIVALGAFFLAPRAAPSVSEAIPSRVSQEAPLPPLPESLPRQKAPVSDAEKEARRLRRYDKNHDNQVSSSEYLASRRKAYAKLDTNGDGVLSFEEYAFKATDKFRKADRNNDNQLSPQEFATTAQKRRPTSYAAHCPPTVSQEEERET